MHRALLIDEILRLIFESCYEHNSSVLPAAAQTCRAWSDPALDLVWHRLPSIRPLVSLIPYVSYTNGQFELSGPVNITEMTVFHSYARRIWEINCRNHLRLHPAILDLLLDVHVSLPHGILPMLKATQLSATGHRLLAFSLKLQRIDLYLGFKESTPVLADSISGYLRLVAEECPDLQQVSVRGLASERFNEAISSMSNIRILCLRLGTSLASNTMNSIMTFPSLQELELHTGHLQVEDIHAQSHQFCTFPSLKKLTIRAQSAFIQFVMEHLQPDTLRSLCVEFQDPFNAQIPWDTLFTTLANKCSQSLEDLSIEYLFEIPDSDAVIDPSSNSLPPNTLNDSSREEDGRLSFTAMRHLERFHQLHKLVIEMSLPPPLTDANISKLVTWWPKLKYLDFGVSPFQLSEQETPRITAASLVAFATHSTNLQTLVLPIELNKFESCIPTNSPSMEQLSSTSKLTRLTTGALSLPNPKETALHLHKLFPSLTEVDGSCDQDPTWAVLRESLQHLRNI